ncbi:MAG: sugar-binding protein, partial [Pseudomonadota bacterium]
MHRLSLALLTSAYCGAIPLSAQADNGQLAHALVADAITVDGELTDWPAHLPRYPIDLQGGNQRRTADANFDAHFRAAYAPAGDALYVALEVLDDHHSVGGTADADWSRQDGVILYLDERHQTRGSGPVLYSVTGPHRRLLSDDSSWDPAVRTAGWEDVEVAVRRTDDGRTVYEWRIATDAPLAPGNSVGLDFLVTDDDTPGQDDPAALYAWGPGLGKSQAGGRVGDLLLVDTFKPLGTLEGQIDWQPLPLQVETSDGERPRPTRVRITPTASPASSLHAVLEPSGHYEALLPPGEYL